MHILHLLSEDRIVEQITRSYNNHISIHVDLHVVSLRNEQLELLLLILGLTNGLCYADESNEHTIHRQQ